MSTLDAQVHQQYFEDFNLWRAVSDAHRKSADLIWAAGGSEAATELASHIVHARRSVRTIRGAPAPIPLVRLVAFEAACNSYLLNAGFAVETLLKAVRVKRLVLAKKTVAFGGGPDRLPTRHEYVQLAKDELKSITQTEHDILERLGLYVQWAGRYPMDRKPPSLANLGRRGCSPTDRETIEALCQRILKRFDSLK